MTSLIARMDHRAVINHSFISRFSVLLSLVLVFLKRKNKSAGFLQVAYVCVGVLMQCSGAGAARIKHVAGVSCRLKELTDLTKSVLSLSLKDFVSTNWNSSPKN